MATQQQLDEAIAARHQLAIGARVIAIRDPSGRQLQFTPTTLKDLNAYIAQLQSELAGAKPVRNRLVYVVPD